ncbi:MAG: rod shape-determining protein MreC [Acidobacteria bacterium SCN 69-37]|nr:MAG: rod shape-determining protein MreC [Acidobacteria bacterium SCN 69-37]
MTDRRTLTLLVTLCVGQVLLISAQVQSREGLSLFQVAAFDAFAGVQRVTGGVTDTIRGIWGSYFGLRGVARENAALRTQLLEMAAELQQQRAIAAQTRALEDLLGLEPQVSVSTLAARVIAGNVSPGTLTVAIDRGTADGVEPDMAVLGAAGVVGRVISPVARGAATVQLLIDSNAAVAVVFERSKAGGLAVGGAADGALVGEFVPSLADVQVGETVMTSGQDGIYPAGFLVGTVERVTGAGTPNRTIRIRPATDFSYLEIVLVALTRPQTATEGGS